MRERERERAKEKERERERERERESEREGEEGGRFKVELLSGHLISKRLMRTSVFLAI